MAKAKSVFVCTHCQAQYPSWAGRCVSCGNWNTLVEEVVDQGAESIGEAVPAILVSLSEVASQAGKRIKTSLPEFDRVLGSDDPGMVSGSVILLAGTPGVGKSTMLLQLCSTLKNAIYFSAEESLEQIKLRSNRIGIKNANLKISSERRLSSILSAIEKHSAQLVVIDSIQTIYDEGIAGTPGSLNQVKDSCWRLMQFAKHRGVTVLIVGHVTKEGIVAGPKTLEHLVDVVLYLEGERRTGLRILRCEKNRFGPIDEVGIWNATSRGFESVDDPGKVFASMVTQDVPGRALTIALEGSRPFLVEVQALVAKTAFGYPKRAVQGIDPNRLNIILAVLENRLNISSSQYDVFINIVGGFFIKDTGIDLAVAAAVFSALKNQILPNDLVLLGEIGLLGEIRPAANRTLRVKEATRLKYRVSPMISSLSKLNSLFAR